MRSTRGFVRGLMTIAAAALVACSGASKGTATSAAPTTAAPAAPSATSTTLAPLAARGVELRTR